MSEAVVRSYRPRGRTDPHRAIFAEEWSEVGVVRELADHPRLLLVVDDGLPADLLAAAECVFPPDSDRTTLRLALPAKSVAEVMRIWTGMTETVPDAVVGIGGGTLCDLVGFAAATYHRGIPHAFVPTTTLAMLDGSIGGNSGVDVAGVKNAVGAMHHPRVVVSVLSALRSLPEAEVRSGLAEAVKAAAVFDADLFTRLEALDDLDPPALLEIVVRAAVLKMGAAEGDDHRRLKFLYGHAVGHALELCADSPLRHGDAVAIGMHLEGAIGVLVERWPESAWLRQAELLKRLRLPTVAPPSTRWEDVAARMRRYRRLAHGGRAGFVLPSGIGELSDDGTGPLTYVADDDLGKTLAAARLLVEGAR